MSPREVMLIPTKEDVLEAIRRVQALSSDEIEAAIGERIGDPLMAGFQLVARDVFGDQPAESVVIQRVQLMVYAYLLCLDLRGKNRLPPSKNDVKKDTPKT